MDSDKGGAWAVGKKGEITRTMINALNFFFKKNFDDSGEQEG